MIGITVYPLIAQVYVGNGDTIIFTSPFNTELLGINVRKSVTYAGVLIIDGDGWTDVIPLENLNELPDGLLT